ncbi:hypothetical protein predicted by Glimmer/Critica (plasmid) [Sinorhizobium fredii HH103]|uniref:Uncharacterized protein n=1 Tax=Sinorhizobium fredii (strain HH103) TaxID=1117943 RepID=G9AJ75_SINF1|nr:hypothetical protein predicted by Glimmer/Critica [Sinorhizobium fredii HH103]
MPHRSTSPIAFEQAAAGQGVRVSINIKRELWYSP